MTRFEKAVIACLVLLLVMYGGLWAWAAYCQSHYECPSCNITEIR